LIWGGNTFNQWLAALRSGLLRGTPLVCGGRRRNRGDRFWSAPGLTRVVTTCFHASSRTSSFFGRLTAHPGTQEKESPSHVKRSTRAARILWRHICRPRAAGSPCGSPGEYSPRAPFLLRVVIAHGRSSWEDVGVTVRQVPETRAAGFETHPSTTCLVLALPPLVRPPNPLLPNSCTDTPGRILGRGRRLAARERTGDE
jgi:hypothetical protein